MPPAVGTGTKSNSPLMLFFYLAGAVFIVLLLFVARIRSATRTRYANAPQRWLGVSLVKFVVLEHSLTSIAVQVPHAVVGRLARALVFITNMCIMLLIAVVLALAKGSKSPPSGAAVASVERLYEALLNALLGVLFSLLFGLPILKRVLRSENQLYRRGALVCTGMTGALAASISGGLLALIALTSLISLQLGAVVLSWTLAVLVDLFLMEPLALIVRYALLSSTAVQVLEGGNGGSVPLLSISKVAPASNVDDSEGMRSSTLADNVIEATAAGLVARAAPTDEPEAYVRELIDADPADLVALSEQPPRDASGPLDDFLAGSRGASPTLSSSLE